MDVDSDNEFPNFRVLVPSIPPSHVEARKLSGLLMTPEARRIHSMKPFAKIVRRSNVLLDFGTESTGSSKPAHTASKNASEKIALATKASDSPRSRRLQENVVLRPHIFLDVETTLKPS
jgi:hypothetical protein